MFYSLLSSYLSFVLFYRFNEKKTNDFHLIDKITTNLYKHQFSINIQIVFSNIIYDILNQINKQIVFVFHFTIET